MSKKKNTPRCVCHGWLFSLPHQLRQHVAVFGPVEEK